MNAYVTCISNLNDDGFLRGVLVLHKSLMLTNPKYPFYCLVSDVVPSDAIAKLEAHGINVIIKPQIDVSAYTGRKNDDYDSRFFKLKIFELDEFEKIVFLDADMLIMKNIDDLFDYEPISVCKDDYQFTGLKNIDNPGCNSGLMVISPDQDMYNKCVQYIPEAIKNGSHGDDQKIISHFLDNPTWLSPAYNMTSVMMDTACYREHYFNLKYKDIRIFHYTWTWKPFMYEHFPIKRFINILYKRRFCELKSLIYYYKIMKQVI